jgi:hypothetical protein
MISIPATDRTLTVRLTALFLLGAALAQADLYTFTTVDDPSAQFYPATYANALNNKGSIVGTYSTSEFNSAGFLYNGSAFSTLSDTKFQLGNETNSTYVYGINDSGVIVGAYHNFFGNYGFEYSSGTFTDITVPGSFGTYATGINDSGQIVGYSYNGFTDSGFLDTNGSFTAINDPQAGSSYGQGTFPWAINNAGAVVGYYIDSNNIVHGFLEQKGTFTTLDDANAGHTSYEGTYALGINDLGQIAGYYVVSGTGQDLGLDYHGFLFQSGSFTTIDDPQALATGGTEIYGINNLGQIVGNYTCSTCGDNYQGFFASANASSVPEPATWSLFLAGMLVVSFVHRARGRQRFPSQAGK